MSIALTLEASNVQPTQEQITILRTLIANATGIASISMKNFAIEVSNTSAFAARRLSSWAWFVSCSLVVDLAETSASEFAAAAASDLLSSQFEKSLINALPVVTSISAVSAFPATRHPSMLPSTTPPIPILTHQPTPRPSLLQSSSMLGPTAYPVCVDCAWTNDKPSKSSV